MAPPQRPPSPQRLVLGCLLALIVLVSLRQRPPFDDAIERRVATLEAVEGNVRNDVVVPRSMLGRLIGAQGGRRHPRATREG